MNTATVDLSIVIVTWNAKKYVRECLTSLLRQTIDCSIEIIVVDNASTDGTPDLVRDEFPQVRLIRNDRNLGFAAANNIGLRETLGDYIYLINSDVVVPDDCLAAVFGYMQQNPEIGLLGPQMRGPDGKVRRSTMRFPTVWNSFCWAVALSSIFRHSKLWGGFLMQDFAHDTVRDVDVLNGWFWVVRRKAFDQVGLLDERFFMYGEDIDWSYRFHQSGWRAVFYPGASALHYGGASSANAPIRFYVEMQRANLQYWEKHSNALGKFGYLASSWLHHILRIFGYAILYSLRRSKRDEAAYKVRRSFASILWLCGLKQEA
jgi:GT2 family glycosyltransferase